MIQSLVLFILSLTITAITSALAAPSTPLLPIEIDTTKAFADSKFPIGPDGLIIRAKEVLSPDVSIGTKDGGKCLAENFRFCAAFVGPIPRGDYLNALGTFQLENSFDITQNAFGFTVSPIQTNRVYWFDYAVATMKAPFFGADPKDVKDDLVLPPQVFHMDFNEEGKVTEFGFYTVDRQYGNTGGLGGAFAYFYGVGKPLPFPEAKPYKPSFRLRIFMFIGKFLDRRKKSN